MFLLPHGGVLVGGQQTVAGLHAGHGQWPLGTRLTRDKDRLLVRLLLLLWQRRHGNLLAEAKRRRKLTHRSAKMGVNQDSKIRTVLAGVCLADTSPAPPRLPVNYGGYIITHWTF